MPKATVHKNGHPLSRKTDIGSPWGTFPVKAVAAKSGRAKGPSELDLRAGVAGSIRAHGVPNGAGTRGRVPQWEPLPKPSPLFGD